MQTAIKTIRKYIDEKKLQHTVETLIRPGPKGNEDVFYFGVGMGIVNGRTVRTIVQRAIKYNREVNIVEIVFREGDIGQGHAITKITKDHNINMIDMASDDVVKSVRLFLRPGDRDLLPKISAAIQGSKELKSLHFARVEFRTVGGSVISL